MYVVVVVVVDVFIKGSTMQKSEDNDTVNTTIIITNINEDGM